MTGPETPTGPADGPDDAERPEDVGFDPTSFPWPRDASAVPYNATTPIAASPYEEDEDE